MRLRARSTASPRIVDRGEGEVASMSWQRERMVGMREYWFLVSSIKKEFGAGSSSVFRIACWASRVMRSARIITTIFALLLNGLNLSDEIIPLIASIPMVGSGLKMNVSGSERISSLLFPDSARNLAMRCLTFSRRVLVVPWQMRKLCMFQI